MNLNTVLLGIVVALGGWTCKTVVEMGNALATTVERVSSQERAMIEMKGRTSDLEHDVTLLRVRAGRPVSATTLPVAR